MGILLVFKKIQDNMKKLTLSLLFFAFALCCSAQSVKFEFRVKESKRFPNLKNCSIWIVSSTPMLEMSRRGETISLENGLKFETDIPTTIPIAENKYQLNLLNSLLKKLCKTEKLNVYKTDAFNKGFSDYTMGEVIRYIEKVMIKHGYSLTFKKEDKESNGHDGYEWEWEYYFFKPQT